MKFDDARMHHAHLQDAAMRIDDPEIRAGVLAVLRAHEPSEPSATHPTSAVCAGAAPSEWATASCWDARNDRPWPYPCATIEAFASGVAGSSVARGGRGGNAVSAR